ncbi:MAG: HDOD domain-containing protein [Desulfobacula sp.]|uniref:EAL and HDOD domain-containing protein n=1 Tax=Desulfobacula sp. TaxID=2593537 RepID=UPI0025BB8FA7|nr:HDOD domain-containing protein [Desulfobacula sp.]MCD4718666.1 HDOD domain-containing protein [Desulfobacula sp.]
MEVFLARQPIFTLEKKIFGYELLFRLGLENAFPDVDGNAATSTLVSNIFFPFDFNEILGGKPGLINFTEKLILQKIPLLLSKDHFIIEVLEDIEPNENVISALSLFCEKGFTIALDDFVYHKKFLPMIELCKIIKFDLRAMPLDGLFDIVKQIKSDYKITLLAEKVETYEEFDQAEEMGFELFQGYFFSKPEVLSTTGISSGQITKLKLINEVGRKELILKNVEKLIKNDAAVSFKLLRFINSAYFNRQNPINTIKDAITYLGTNELRKFISIVVISDLSTKKPNELVRTSIIRARMCERCGTVLNTRFSIDELFTLGLFSLMDAILDCKMEDILEQIVLSEKMETALFGRDKEFKIILNIVKSFEQGNWKNAFFTAISGKSIETKLPEFYFDSVKMANSFF